VFGCLNSCVCVVYSTWSEMFVTASDVYSGLTLHVCLNICSGNLSLLNLNITKMQTKIATFHLSSYSIVRYMHKGDEHDQKDH
jgi:hypothetical protein